MKRKNYEPVRSTYNSLQYFADKATSTLINFSESIVIGGFWRSGTTVLLKLIGDASKGKTVFEPLHPNSPNYADLYPNFDKNTLKIYHPLPDENIFNQKKGTVFLKDCLTGNMSASWTRRERQSLWESLRTRTVVKTVRGSLLLPLLEETFGIWPIYILRDPRAVVASVTRKNWGQFLENFSLKKYFLELPSCRENLFSKYKEMINEYENRSLESRISLMYAILISTWRDISSTNTQFVSYENLIVNPQKTLDPVIDHLNLKSSTSLSSILSQETSTTSYWRQGSSKNERLFGWKDELSKDTIEEIEAVFQKINLEEIMYDQGKSSL